VNQKTCQILIDRCYELAKLSNCQKRQFGAVIVPTEVTSTGYDDPCEILDTIRAYGVNLTYDRQPCDPCLRADVPSGTRTELCRAVHAEQMALLNFAQRYTGNLSGFVMFVAGREGSVKLVKDGPGFYCTVCARLLAAARLDGIIVRTEEGAESLSMAGALMSAYGTAGGHGDGVLKGESDD